MAVELRGNHNFGVKAKVELKARAVRAPLLSRLTNKDPSKSNFVLEANFIGAGSRRFWNFSRAFCAFRNFS